MKKNFFTMVKSIICFFIFFFSTQNLIAQVGIGTTSPNVSSMLDVSSTSKGMLTPRMTTVQRNAITTPADGLIVYDTTLKFFYHYNSATSSWIRINSEVNGRLNFKRIKSTDVLATVLASELTLGGGSKYMLDPSTYYEINGTIIVDFPIELNNAYLVGLDANEDKLIRAGNLFIGGTGGTVKNISITVTGGNVFTLSGNATQTLLLRDSIVSGCSNVGTVSGFGLVFFSVVQYTANTTGITYSGIGRLLLNNTAWFGNNTGTFEKFTGNFTLIQKQGGFCEVNGTAIGVDVSGNPTISGDAVMEAVVFTGTLTSGMYVNPYTTGTYSGYNFNNNWNVRCPGIPSESDSAATGNFGADYNVGFGYGINITNNTTKHKIAALSTTSNIFRFSSDGASTLTYLGKKKRIFQITGSISFQVPAAGTYIVYIAKNGSSGTIDNFKIYGKGAAASDIVVLPLNAVAELAVNDYIEVYIQRYSGSNGSVVIPNMTLTIK